jgi:hypothetical protein
MMMCDVISVVAEFMVIDLQRLDMIYDDYGKKSGLPRGMPFFK